MQGLPIGSVTSQLFANVYLDACDHFIKEALGVKYYLRYTDDICIVHHDREYLASLPGILGMWLAKNRALELHPRKIILRKLSQGIDWLGWVQLPWHRVVRTKTRRRMIWRIQQYGRHDQLQSYLGLLSYGDAWEIRKNIVSRFGNLT